MILNQSKLNLLSDENAQGLVEYSLIISLVVLAILGTFLIFRSALLDVYNVIKVEIEEI